MAKIGVHKIWVMNFGQFFPVLDGKNWEKQVYPILDGKNRFWMGKTQPCLQGSQRGFPIELVSLIMYLIQYKHNIDTTILLLYDP